MAGNLHRTRKKPRIQKVQNGVLHPTDILIDIHPVIGFGPICWGVGPRRGKADEIPGRVNECIHRVCFTQGCATAGWTVAVAPCRVTVKRVSGLVECHIIGQPHW